MAEVVLPAQARTETGSAAARRLRSRGRIPATLYGRGVEARSVTVDARELAATLHTVAGANVLIDLRVDGEAHLAMARALDRHPVRGDILHVDFMKIARDQRISVEVSLTFEGDAKGVREGGKLDTHLYHVAIECLATAVPERLVVDVSDLGVGDTLRVGDISAPEGVEITTPVEEVVIGCVIPQEMKVEAELEVAAEAAPEAEAAAAVEAPAAEAPAAES